MFRSRHLWGLYMLNWEWENAPNMLRATYLLQSFPISYEDYHLLPLDQPASVAEV